MTETVKALDWSDGGPGYLGSPTLVSETIVGLYVLEQYGDWCVYFDRTLQSKGHPSPEAAKAAAQADFERRILSCLSPFTGDVEPVAWQWQAGGNWYTAERPSIADPEQYARAQAGGSAVRPIWTTSPPVPEARQEWRTMDRHVKRGSEYQLIGVGKMQVTGWYDPSKTISTANVDMREVAIYRGEDGQLWVRPVEEFNDGRFASSPTPSKGDAPSEATRAKMEGK